jgi:hypothetical protein
MFEISAPLDVKDEGYDTIGIRNTANIVSLRQGTGPIKVFLPRRSGESLLGPRQYYYTASRTGVVPNWRVGE